MAAAPGRGRSRRRRWARSRGASFLRLSFRFREATQRVHAVALLFEALATGEVEQLDQERKLDDAGAHTLHERERGERGAAGREQVIDDHDALAAREAIDVDLDAVRAVLERVVVPDRVVRQLA